MSVSQDQVRLGSVPIYRTESLTAMASKYGQHFKKVKITQEDMSVCTPKDMEKQLHAAPPHLIPVLAVGAFTGIRMAELNRLNRLNWSAFDLDSGFIELRADQAKTGSRLLVRITDNLRAWIEPLPREGKLVRHAALHREVTALARALKMECRETCSATPSSTTALPL